MSPVFWSNAKSPIQRPGGIFWRAGRFARIQAAAKQATASFGTHTSFPATISASGKKAIATFRSTQLPEGDIAAAGKKQVATLGGVMEPRGIISAQMGKAVAKLLQADLSTVHATGLKSAVTMSAKEIEQASLNVLIHKATALLSVSERDIGTIGATGKKSVAAFSAHAPAPPIFDSTAGYAGTSAPSYTHTLAADANCLVGMLFLTSTDTSIASGDVSLKIGTESVPLLNSDMAWHTFSTTAYFAVTYNWQGCVWVFGVIDANIPKGAQTVQITSSVNGSQPDVYSMRTWSFKNALSFDPVQFTGDLNTTAPSQSASAMQSSIVCQGFYESGAISSGSFSAYNQTQDASGGAGSTASAFVFGHASGPSPVFSATAPSGWDILGTAVPVNGS